MSARHLIPHSFTLARLLLFPEFLRVWHQRLTLFAFGILALIVVSDALDGYLARKLDAASSAGALFDVCADFCVIFGAFALFAMQGLYPFWLLVVIAGMFAQFLLTNVFFKRVIYDPFGKYFGRLLFVTVGATVLMPIQSVCMAFSAFLLGLALVSFSTRWLLLRNAVRA